MKTELLARNALRHGDAVTPLVLASANADTERHRAATAYLCGPPAMIDAAVELVTRRGVRPRNVYFDAFVLTG